MSYFGIILWIIIVKTFFVFFGFFLWILCKNSILNNFHVGYLAFIVMFLGIELLCVVLGVCRALMQLLNMLLSIEHEDVNPV
jgi:hypothetical protein